MGEKTGLRRRDVLSGALRGAGVALLPPAWALLGACAGEECPAGAIEGLADTPGLAALGHRHLLDAPGDRDADATRKALCTDWSAEERRAAPDEVRARLGRQVRDDFAAGRVVDIDGWILSRTEARIAALAALAR